MEDDAISQMISSNNLEEIRKDNTVKNNVNKSHEDRCEHSYSTFQSSAVQ